MLTIDDHPLLDAIVFTSTWPAPLAQLDAPAARAFFSLDAPAPLSPDDGDSPDQVKKTVRDLLRWNPAGTGGFKPTGRSKPASEYLLKAVEQGWLAPDKGINPAVDVCNAVSLHSGLPISVVDADLAQPPYRLALCEPGTAYVFNPAGQVIDLGGLICLHDAQGPCGGPVKDSQRTKTHDGTVHTLTVIWGTSDLPGRAQAAWQWYQQLLDQLDVRSQLLTG